jgi:hypothetical protein
MRARHSEATAACSSGGRNKAFNSREKAQSAQKKEPLIDADRFSRTDSLILRRFICVYPCSSAVKFFVPFAPFRGYSLSLRSLAAIPSF